MRSLTASVAMGVLALVLPGCRSASVTPGLPSAAVVPPAPEVPLAFIENTGQTDRRARFLLDGSATDVFFTPTGLRFALRAEGGAGWSVGLSFVGARRVRPVGRAATGGIVSYFRGGPGEWATGARVYDRIVYRDLWPGIDLVTESDQGRLKYAFRVGPGADPSLIRMRWRGATGLVTGEDGRLEVSTPAGSLTDQAPVSTQGPAGRRVDVASAFVLEGDGVVGFRLGPYDSGRLLVIDPAVILYSGYVGGAGSEFIADVDVDAQGNAYVVGDIEEPAGFPATLGPDTTHNSPGAEDDAFIAKISPEGQVVYAGFIGGDARDRSAGVAVDATGAAYATGLTNGGSFPTAVGPDTSFNGSFDAWVAKVAPDGSGLVYSGFLGGTDSDFPKDVAVDAVGNAYLTGSTSSNHLGDGFPVLVGPDLEYNGGFDDAFVARVNAAGTGFDYVGYLGGGLFDDGRGIDVDAAGSAYVAGFTSDPPGFPTTVGPDTSPNGGDEAFVAKVRPDGSGLAYSGFIGGASGDFAEAVAVDQAGSAHVVGGTGSEVGFPATVGPDLTPGGGGNGDGFVAKVAPDGTGFLYAGFIGGPEYDNAFGVGVDPLGNAYVAGETASATGFPVIDGPDLTFNGDTDAFVVKLPPDGSVFAYGGYVGGPSFESGRALAVDLAGNAVVAGSAGDGLPVLRGPDLTFNGGGDDGFVARVQTTETCQGRPVTLLGSEGNDVLAGSNAPDVIEAAGGGDRIATLGGRDRVCGGAGNDRVRGGAGNDRLQGEQGKDRLNAGAGKRDRCAGGPGKDRGRGCEKGKL